MQHPHVDYTPLIILIIFIFLLRFVFKASKSKLKDSAFTGTTQYQRIEELFSPAERSFLGVLDQALDENYIVFGKVRLGDIIQPKRGLSRSNFYSALNRINKKHVDFVVCRKKDFKIVGIVELDDKSHNRSDRKERDKFVYKVLGETRIPILHFSAKSSYPVNEVRSSLGEAFSLWKSSEDKVTGDEFGLDGARDIDEAPSEEWKLGDIEESPVEKKESPEEICPDCGSIMRARKVSNGPHQGKFFFVCPGYPKCRTVKRVVPEMA